MDAIGRRACKVNFSRKSVISQRFRNVPQFNRFKFHRLGEGHAAGLPAARVVSGGGVAAGATPWHCANPAGAGLRSMDKD